jgi:hypothetical protein
MSDNPTQEPKPYVPIETTASTPRPETEASNAPPQGPVITDHRSVDRGGGHSQNWIWGIVLIALGGIFLLQNMTPFRLVNWWAIFILLPAAGSFTSAWRKYKEDGRLGSGARSALFGGVIFSVVAAIFLFNLDLGKLWPIFIIAAGLAVMVNSLLPD